MILAKVGLGRIPSLIRHVPEIAKPVMNRFLQDSARSLISSSGKVPGLVQVSPPHSEGKRGLDARKQGEKSVMAGVWQVYATPGKVYPLLKKKNPRLAAAYWHHITHKRWPAAESIMRTVLGQGFAAFDDGAAHMKRRTRRGRVGGGRTPSIILRDGASVRRYIKRRQANVGLLAAGISAAYNGRFGPLRGVPAWIRRHTSSWAQGTVIEHETRRGGMLITITLNAGALERDVQRRFNYVLFYRLKAMERQLPYIARSVEAKLAAQLQNA